ncbi:MAG: cyclic nucleotide-binding domain-containing protein, partial [Pseudomonadota bacterium]
VSADVLLPYMTTERLGAGETLFRHGDTADRLYYVMSGRVHIAEFDRYLEKGALIGEIGLFTHERTRTATAIAAEDTQLSWIAHDAVLVLCQKNPEFALVLTRLIAERMAENQSVLLARLSAAAKANP